MADSCSSELPLWEKACQSSRPSRDGVRADCNGELEETSFDFVGDADCPVPKVCYSEALKIVAIDYSGEEVPKALELEIDGLKEACRLQVLLAVSTRCLT